MVEDILIRISFTKVMIRYAKSLSTIIYYTQLSCYFHKLFHSEWSIGALYDAFQDYLELDWRTSKRFACNWFKTNIPINSISTTARPVLKFSHPTIWLVSYHEHLIVTFPKLKWVSKNEQQDKLCWEFTTRDRGK